MATPDAYQTTLQNVQKDEQASRSRQRSGQQKFSAILDLIDAQNASAADVAAKQSPVGGNSTKVFRDKGGQVLPTGSKGPSRGPNNVKLATWRWHGINITSEAGKTAASFRGLLNDLAAGGYKVSSAASYANRNARGSNRLSEHAYGRALDINPSQNPMTSNAKFRTNMPSNINVIARNNGLVWGGSWFSKKDPMHFSTTGW
jgi:hypothetical protein